MRISTVKDEQGRTVGISRVDENGNSIDTRRQLSYQQRQTPRPTQGSLPVLPDVSGGTGEDLTLSEQIENSDIDDVRFSNDGGELSSNSSTDGSDTTSERTPSADEYQGPGFDSNFTSNFQANRKKAEYAVREGNFGERLLGRATLGSMALSQGAADGVQDITDFAASVGDLLLRREVNDSDNLINFRREGTKPTSVVGNLTSEATSFITSSGILSVLPGTKAVMSVGKAGAGTATVAQRIGAELVKDTFVSFIKAKPTEDNIFDAVAGTALESSVSRYLSSSNKTEENYFLGKVRTTAANLPLDVVFGVAGEGLSAAVSKFATEPLAHMLTGLKAAKAVEGTDAESELLEAAVREAGEIQRELQTELGKELNKTLDDALEKVEYLTNPDVSTALPRNLKLEGDLPTNKSTSSSPDITDNALPNSLDTTTSPTPGTNSSALPGPNQSDLGLTRLRLLEDSIAEIESTRLTAQKFGDVADTAKLNALAKRQLELEDEIDRLVTANPDFPQRSKQAVRQQLVSTRYQQALEANPGSTVNTQALADVDGVDVKSVNSVDEVLNLRASNSSTDRFINTSKLSASTDVRAAVKATMDSMPNSLVKDSISRPRIVREAKEFLADVVGLSGQEADRAFLVMAGSSENVPKAALAGRMMIKDLAEQVSDVVVKAGDDVDLNTVEGLAVAEDFAYKLSRLELYVASYKNLSKASAQTLNFSGIDLSSSNIDNLLQKAEYLEAAGKADKDSGVADYFESLKSMFSDGAEGKKRLTEAMNDFKASDGNLAKQLEVGKAIKYKQRTLGSNLADIALGVRVNGLLSGSRTHAANIFSGLSTSLLTPTYQILGASLTAPTRLLNGGKALGGEVDEAVIRQSLAQLNGLQKYFSDSMSLAAAAFRTGKPILEDLAKTSDVESRLDLVNPETGSWLVDGVLKTLSLPSRLLVTGDELVKQLNYRSFVHAKAVDRGIREGLRDAELDAYVKSMVDLSLGVDEKTGIRGLGLDQEALDYSKYITFQTEISREFTPTRSSLKNAVDALGALPGGKYLRNLFLPFVQTPLNILAYSSRFTPVAALSKQYRDDIAAGGLRKSRAIGETAVGLSVLGSGMMLALQDKLIGRGPSFRDESARNKFYADGKQPYSIKLGGSWVSLNRLEPFGMLLGLTSDIVYASSVAGQEAEGGLRQASTAALVSAIASVKDRTFFEGISQLLELVDSFDGDTKRTGKEIDRFIQRQSSTLVPYSSLLRELRQELDPVYRETESVIDSVYNIIPGLSTELEPRRNWWDGSIATYNSAPMLNIFPATDIRDNPTLDKLAELGISLRAPLGRGKEMDGRKLTAEQYSRYLELVGATEVNDKRLMDSWESVLSEELPKLSADDVEYMKVNDEFRQSTPLAREIDSVTREYKKIAKAKLYQEFPELKLSATERDVNRGLAREGTLRTIEPLGAGAGVEEIVERTDALEELLDN